MLDELSSAVQRVLRTSFTLSGEHVNQTVTFRRAAPEASWASGLSLPVVGVYCMATSHQPMTSERPGLLIRMGARYAVTCWGTGADEETAAVESERLYETLWRGMFLAETAGQTRTDRVSVSLGSLESDSSLWAALKMPPRPGLLLTAEGRLDLTRPTAPPVLQRDLRLVTDPVAAGPLGRTESLWASIGGRVVSAGDGAGIAGVGLALADGTRTETDRSGYFAFRRVPAGDSPAVTVIGRTDVKAVSPTRLERGWSALLIELS